MTVNKLHTQGGDGRHRPNLDDNVILAYRVYQYDINNRLDHFKGELHSNACIEGRLRAFGLSWLHTALMYAGGGMTTGEKAVFFVTIPQDRSLVNDQAAKDVILDLELRAINLQYRSEVYASLPPFGYAVQLFEDRQRLQSIFDAVKPVFAEYNKWDEYGIALPFKDTDLMPHERLVFSNGISTPWRKTSQHAIERLIVPRCLRAWRGGAAAYSYQLQSHGPETLRDLDFEHRAVAYLGELALERLSYPIQGISDTVIYEVEGTQGRARVLYPQEISECLTRSGNAVPILWQFRRFREGASDRYRITPTRFRLRESEDQTRLPAELSCDDRRTEHSSSSPYKRSALKVSPRTSTAQRHADSRNEETLRMVDSGVAQPERSSAVLSRYGDLPKRRFLRRGLSKMSIGIGDSRKWSERL